MPFVFKRLALLLSITAAVAADNDAFRPAPAASLPHHQTTEQVTVGADAYFKPSEVKLAFGKVDPNDYGVLPVLVVIQNDSNKTLQLDHMRAQYMGPNNSGVDATPAADVKYVRSPDRPSYIPGPAGAIKVLKGKKNPLTVWQIEGRAFSAKLLPPGQSANGFFYFQTDLRPGATIFLTGLAEAGTGKQLFYFEVPLE